MKIALKTMVVLLGMTFSGLAQEKSAKDTIANWPEASKKAAAEMMEKYGDPAGITDTMLVWHKTGPWKRTIVYNEPVEHKFPKPHEDVLEQFIDYKVPPEKFSALAEFDGSVVVNRTNGEISARCDKEGMNFLALNLAHDIVSGKQSVEDARQKYADTAAAAMKGEKPQYTTGLEFQKPEGNTADPDEPVKPQE